MLDIRVSKALNAIPGVTAQVQLEQNRALITMDRPIADETLIRAVTDAGYQAELLN